MNHVPRRSIMIAGRKTSITLEDAFWIALKEIARARNMPLSDLVATIDSERHLNLSSAIRVFVLDFYRDQIGIAGLAAVFPAGGDGVDP
jgi:predicted DNA-binding ribbon-helix-helix protein